MPGRRGATLLEDLPEEIIDKILIRLPPKDVGRSRLVSASWRSVTSTPAFMLEHRRRQPSLPTVDGHGRPASLVVVSPETDAQGSHHQQLWPFLPGSEHRSQHCLRGACDGFLIVSRGHQFYICNPVIRTRVLLPQPERQYNTIAGFYCHHSTREYRVLWVSQSLDLSNSSLYIVTVGSSDKPRQVRVSMLTDSSPSEEHKLLNKLRFSSDCSPPVHHRGSLHWRPYSASDLTGGRGDIIVFDTESESFRWMRGPAQPCHCRKLFDMEGTLAFWGGSTPRSTSMDVWVMQDYEAETWAFKYQIDLSTVEVSRKLHSASSKKKPRISSDSTVRLLNDVAVLNNHELLIMFNRKHVLRCDTNGKFLGVVNIGTSQYCMLLTHHRLQESIVPIPGHGMMQGKDEEPPFS
ncbi:F-box protein [Hordeum vulgare]|uniref:F-box domain-containing protein n=1 Tax=Hordeum vulgare subsp. vulgare TaxID=112509 RepID=A0A8I6Z9F2_HORVV|nr:F-box/LRR-repeat/kelch-repeat protein At1g09650-like [Hordeum vulgare subsp. vulgare]KAE8784416.1 F-box protein [Hordeum vulgare]